MEGKYRPQPVFNQGEREEGAAEQTFAVDSPFDLVGNLRSIVEQARAEWVGEFNAAIWMRGELEGMVGRMCATDTPESERKFFFDLQDAYDIIAYWHYPSDDYRDTVAMELKGNIMAFERSSITLNPLGVQLLDAMAVATDIPDYTPGQSIIEYSHVIDLAEVSDLFGQEAG